MSSKIVKHPKVSIGLAVYNGEKYLEEAIDSILRQTFTDFELIISDNASTDRTAEICQVYAQKDERVRYHRNATNIGGANNENQTFRMARGEYFRWAAHDDICAPTLLEKCIEVLEQDSSVVLCHTVITKIDEKGEKIGELGVDEASSMDPVERFKSLTGFNHQCEASYGLIRSDALSSTGLQRNYTDSDRTLLAHLSLIGRFHQIPESLFFKRIHPEMSTAVHVDWRARMLWFDAKNETRITFPHWMQFLHYFEIIFKTPLSFKDRIRCFLHMGPWLMEDRRWGKIINDVIIAFRKRLRRVNGRSLIAINES